MEDKLTIQPIDKAKTICNCRKVNLLDVKTMINNHKDEDKETILLNLKTSLGAGAKCGCCISPDNDPNSRKNDYLINYISAI